MLLDRPIVAFDIETIPDPEIGRRLLHIEGDDETVIREMVRQRLAETDQKSEYPQPPWHRVVAICATLLGPKSGRVEVRALGGETGDERSLLEAFFALFKNTERPPRLVSWNGSGFDIPVIRYRSMLYGLAAPVFYRSDGDFRFSNYQNRYHDMHVDLMDVLTGHGASTRVGLDNFSKTMGLPGKSFLERAIYEHYFLGELPRVVEYCKLDTVQTMLAFLLYAHHRGELSEADLLRYVDGTRETIAGFSFEGWRTIEAALVGWPKWATRDQSTT
jgi:predicted PolB exonuclease-like 3'-5' exonuclease